MTMPICQPLNFVIINASEPAAEVTHMAAKSEPMIARGRVLTPSTTIRCSTFSSAGSRGQCFAQPWLFHTNSCTSALQKPVTTGKLSCQAKGTVSSTSPHNTFHASYISKRIYLNAPLRVAFLNRALARRDIQRRSPCRSAVQKESVWQIAALRFWRVGNYSSYIWVGSNEYVETGRPMKTHMEMGNRNSSQV